ncbi:sugar ABC transporter ATP-binding protein [Curvibacter sp. CHRR-16]|uniref:sugar ABC transporter ATP-binding protein n=1 Tax=Curvibacter sp. CHRR-16 TaxID=2835872 RepID=UPI001BDA0CC1|nr:sugar ABC transporter ATP-binding protein [Curvibacter sp. CHRR-16]MBT0570110.1 sugar ABC transporter ATP-binding protein [Curvibacter sp. CHRR-16]
MSTLDKPPVLSLVGISKRFGAALALHNVSLQLRAGEIHALMGQNGAGKSTLIKVLTGVYQADSGSATLEGLPLQAQSPAHAQALGISTVYQEVNLCPNLSVAENIFAGRYPRKGWMGAGLIDWPRMHHEARQWLGKLNLDIDVTAPLAHYPVAVQQMVAIARALSIDAKVLVLDEPTSSLDDDEVHKLYAVMRQLKAQGMAVLFVTHFLDQVYAVSDRITVLRNGELVGEYLASDLDHNALIAAMVGRSVALADSKPQAAHKQQASGAWLSMHGVGRKGALKPSQLDIRAGEIVGLGGLLGSGRTELARLLFGLDARDSGTVQIKGKHAALQSPVQAIATGMGMCPEDRKAEGIVAALSVRENIVLALQARQGLWPAISYQRQMELANHYIALLGIKTEDANKPIGLLSGGNQQKAVLARWMATQPALLILDEPTRGIDIAAKQEIMNQIMALAQEGMAVVFISSEMEEVVRVSHRIVVLRDREIVGELPAGSSEQAVYAVIAGHT